MKKLLFILCFLPSCLFSQGLQIPTPDSILTWHTRPPIIKDPVTGKKVDSFIDELAVFIQDRLDQLGVHDVLVGIYCDSATYNNENIFRDKKWMDLNEIGEVLIITDAQYIQAEIQKKGELKILPPKPDSLTAARAKKVRTHIEMVSYFFDVENQNLLGDCKFSVSYTGGDIEKSHRKAFNRLGEKVTSELKRIYWYSADLDTVRNGRFEINLGTENGIRRGMAFEIMEPDREWITKEIRTIVSGGRAGFARVTSVDTNSCQLRILRQWRQLYSDSWAVEQNFSVHALQLHIIPPATNDYLNVGFLITADPIGKFDWGLGIQFMRVTDSKWENDYGFGFGAFGLWRFLNSSKYDLGLRLGLDLDLPFKKDDTGEIVNTVLFSSYLGLMLEFPISQRFDFFTVAGYRLGFRANDWQFSEDEESYPAYWEEKTPEVNNSGILMSFGLKYYFFGF
ncbi:hypothetical protein JW935_26315 [candidate division KSB1 bacterium]|nr:hypothetical protein [candidate division KSB1 bacterium]